jgi:hypothetical protein
MGKTFKRERGEFEAKAEREESRHAARIAEKEILADEYLQAKMDHERSLEIQTARWMDEIASKEDAIDQELWSSIEKMFAPHDD